MRLLKSQNETLQNAIAKPSDYLSTFSELSKTIATQTMTIAKLNIDNEKLINEIHR